LIEGRSPIDPTTAIGPLFRDALEIDSQVLSEMHSASRDIANQSCGSAAIDLKSETIGTSKKLSDLFLLVSEHWLSIKLSDLCTLLMGKSPVL
jgi:hypothetical protein